MSTYEECVPPIWGDAGATEVMSVGWSIGVTGARGTEGVTAGTEEAVVVVDEVEEVEEEVEGEEVEVEFTAEMLELC